MASAIQGKGGWRRFRKVFRWVRISVLLLVCLLVGSVVYLNHAGFPGFLQRKLSAELARRGFDVAFSTLRLDGYRKIIVRNLKFAGTDPGAPRLFINEATLRLDRSALAHFQLQVDGLSIREGRMVIPLAGRTLTNQFLLEHVQTELEFKTNNNWILNHGEASAFGARLHLSGNITNALSFQKLRIGSNTNTVSYPEQLQQLVQVMQRFEFRTPPELSLTITGDARDLTSFRSTFTLQTADAKTPWGRTENLAVHAQLEPSTDGVAGHIDVTLDSARTPWGRLAKASIHSSGIYPAKNGSFKSDWQFDATELDGSLFKTRALHGTVQSSDRDGTLVTRIAASADSPRIGRVQAAHTQFEAELAHESPFRNASAIFLEGGFLEFFSRIGAAWSGQWSLKVDKPQSEFAACDQLVMTGTSASDTSIAPANAALGFWTFFQPFNSDVTLTTSRPVFKGVNLEDLSANAIWDPPLLNLRSLKIAGLGGTLSASGTLDVLSRTATLSLLSDLAIRQVADALGDPVKSSVADISFKQSPQIQISSSSVLPTWTNWPANWVDQVLSSNSFEGEFRSGEATFRSIPILKSVAQFAVTNRLVFLKNLELDRTEGSFRGNGEADLKSSGFQAQFESHLDPHFGTNFLAPDAREVGEIFQFPEPPALAGVVSGNWTNLETLRFDGRLGLTNFLFKNEPVTSLASQLHYTNGVVRFNDLAVLRGSQRVDIESGAYPISEEVIDVTNVVSTLDPAWFAKISTHVIQKAIGPYIFDKPPLVHAYGRIPILTPSKADIHFGVGGEAFHYWRFSAPRISGGIWWKGDTLSVTNIKADFYNGHLDWEGHFHFLPNDSADYNFRAGLTNINLPTIVADLVQTTNDMKGELTGNLVVTDANTDDMLSWRGYGNASVRNGFLWNIPLFGNFTHLLGNISPNLGTLPATAADMTFTLEKSVVHTHDLEMKTSAMRLKYMGTVEIDGRLDARVEAILLRDWVFGKAISMAFWPISKILEYRVTGTLQTPKSRPLYLPGILTSPIHSIKKLVPGSKDKSAAEESKPAEPARDQKENHNP